MASIEIDYIGVWPVYQSLFDKKGEFDHPFCAVYSISQFSFFRIPSSWKHEKKLSGIQKTTRIFAFR